MQAYTDPTGTAERRPATHAVAVQPLVGILVGISAALAVAILAVRNLYDDELFSFDRVLSPVRQIVRVSAEGDVHPPGMYLLAHAAHLLIPSLRWMNLVPGLILYLGLAVFARRLARLFARTPARLGFLLLACLHPQLLLWGVTLRWYSPWTGLALGTLVVALQPGVTRPTLSLRRALTLAMLLAALFYLSYITLLYAAALTVAMPFVYRSEPRGPLLRRVPVAALLLAALTAPQLRLLLTVHLAEGAAQRSTVAVSALRMMQSMLVSEAYLPWNPIGLLAGAAFLLLLAHRLRELLRSMARKGSHILQYPLAPLSVFAAVFCLLLVFSGLGGKPRNGLLLIPLFAMYVARAVDPLRLRTQTALLALFAVWSVLGCAHLLTREGSAKSDLVERPEQVTALLARTRAEVHAQDARDSGKPANPTAPEVCAVVVTYDPELAFTIAQQHPTHTVVLSPYRGSVFHDADSSELCPRTVLFVVRSYLGGNAQAAAALNAQLEVATQYFSASPRIVSLSPDPDAARKRRLAALLPSIATLGQRLPDFRYTVEWAPMNAAHLPAMRQRLTYFLSGQPVESD